MKLRAATVVALLLGSLPLSSGAITSAACASEGPRAVLVVDTGSGVHRFCVSLPADRVSGIDVIELAGSQHGLQYKLGFGGKAVCQLAGVGPDGDDCFADDPYFWGYWRGDGGGGWTWSSAGAASTVVRDGGVEGWSWGTGQDGGSHPQPPATTFESVCPAVASSAGGSKSGAPTGSGAGGDASTEPEPSGRKASIEGDREGEGPKTSKKRKKAARARPENRAARPMRADGTTSPAQILAAGTTTGVEREDEDGRGPPRAGVTGLAVAAGLLMLGALRARRRGPRR